MATDVKHNRKGSANRMRRIEFINKLDGWVQNLRNGWNWMKNWKNGQTNVKNGARRKTTTLKKGKQSNEIQFDKAKY